VATQAEWGNRIGQFIDIKRSWCKSSKEDGSDYPVLVAFTPLLCSKTWHSLLGAGWIEFFYEMPTLLRMILSEWKTTGLLLKMCCGNCSWEFFCAQEKFQQTVMLLWSETNFLSSSPNSSNNKLLTVEGIQQFK